MKTCCVFGCTACMYDGVSFFKFPKDAKLRKKWIRLINRANWKPSDSAVVCSRHFEDHEVERTNKPQLKKGVCPTLRLKGTPGATEKRRPIVPVSCPCQSLSTFKYLTDSASYEVFLILCGDQGSLREFPSHSDLLQIRLGVDIPLFRRIATELVS